MIVAKSTYFLKEHVLDHASMLTLLTVRGKVGRGRGRWLLSIIEKSDLGFASVQVTWGGGSRPTDYLIFWVPAVLAVCV
jgi:hypothetical protein